MYRTAHLLPSLLATLLLLTACADGGAAADEPAGPPHPERVVVLELFTSQGCSSCPPADRLLTELARDPDLAGKVIPLSLHVDYWNYIGWTDPFSSAGFSERQRRYAGELSGRVYTPQLVVDGRYEAVGSQRSEVRELVARALAAPPAGRVELSATPPADGRVAVTVSAALAAEADSERAELVVALFEDGLDTSVPRGENAGRDLHNDGVVRRLERVFTVTPEGGSKREVLTLPVEPGWRPENLGVAAFLQDAGSLEVLAADVERFGG